MKLSEIVFEQVETVPGWLLKSKCECFDDVYSSLYPVVTVTPPLAVEIGVWFGKSAIAQALMIKALRIDMQLVAIDPWSADAALDGTNDPANDRWWQAQNFEEAKSYFEDELKLRGLRRFVNVWRDKAENCVNEFEDERIDILHIDGNHSPEQSMADVMLWLPKVKKGGYIILDDTNWPSLSDAVRYMGDNCVLMKEVSEEGQGFALYRKSKAW